MRSYVIRSHPRILSLQQYPFSWQWTLIFFYLVLSSGQCLQFKSLVLFLGERSLYIYHVRIILSFHFLSESFFFLLLLFQLSFLFPYLSLIHHALNLILNVSVIICWLHMLVESANGCWKRVCLWRSVLQWLEDCVLEGPIAFQGAQQRVTCRHIIRYVFYPI